MGQPANHVIGTAKGESLQGTAGGDFLEGLGGNDTLTGGDGDDWLFGGAGIDLIFDGAGSDICDLAGGSGRIWADTTDPNGNDTYIGTFTPLEPIASPNGDAVVYADIADGLTINLEKGWATGSDIGHDKLQGINCVWLYGGDNKIIGSSGKDRIVCDGDDDRIFGGDGDDVVWYRDGDRGNDFICGGNGNDALYGGGGEDRLYGGDGDDALIADWDDGRGGRNWVYGGDGNDSIHCEEGDDKVRGDAGDDTISAGGGRNVLMGGEGADTFVFDNDLGFESGQTFVKDFEDGIDRLSFREAAYDKDWFLAHAQDTVHGVALCNEVGQRILVLHGIGKAQIDVSDFL